MDESNRNRGAPRPRRVRLRVLPATTLSMVLLVGCTSALADLDPRPDPVERAEPVTQEVPEAPTSLDPRVERYLAPYANARDGAVRKIGSDYYERTDGRWVERTCDHGDR